MPAANPTERLVSPAEFRQVLDRARGLVVARTELGKPFQEVMLGQEHWYEIHHSNARRTEETCFDFQVGPTHLWRITKHGRIISRSDMLFTFAIGPFRRVPSFDSLHQAVVSSISVGAAQELVVRFADEQQLVMPGLLQNKDGDEYPNWYLQVPGAIYGPAAGGNTKVTSYNTVRFA